MKNKNLLRFFSVLLSVTCVVSMLSFDMKAYAEETDEYEEAVVLPVKGDDFTTITVQSADDLYALSKICMLDTASEKLYVELKNDISLKGRDFVPIPYFAGIFNGNGYTISGLSCVNSNEPVGLFSTIGKGALVENLCVAGNITPSDACNYIGAIAGNNSGIIYNSSFTGVVTGTSYVGGIAGINTLTGMIVSCDSNGAIRGDDMTGGIAGINNGTIISCENMSLINTESDDRGVDIASLDLEFTLDISKLNTQKSSSCQDMGGIAGYSSGIISNCSNLQSVGYGHTGYNVGGIAGRSCGYIHKCTNKATVMGRKDIGGICGQMEPYISTQISDSTLRILEGQLNDMQALVSMTQSDAENAGSAVNSRIDKLNDYVSDAQKSAEELSDGAIREYDGIKDKSYEDVSSEAEDIISKYKGESVSSIASGAKEKGETDMQAVNQELFSSLDGLNTQLDLLNKEAKGYSDQLNSDIKAINNKYAEIKDTIASVKDVSFEIEDASTISPDLITLGAIRRCENSGEILGDLNVGGIAGAMGQESSVDPEDEISLSLDFDTHKEYEYKAVVDNCVNNGALSTKRNYCGGITARAEVGYIKDCESYGRVEAGGNYAGGIAATSEITIRNCYAKASLSGDKYVGGIIGLGVNESTSGVSSLVADCRSLVSIEGASKFYGAIASTMDGSFDNNVFTGSTLSGLGAYSKAGMAEPVAYEELIAGNVPDEFKSLHLVFVSEGTVLKTIDFEYGDSFDSSVYPELPSKRGYFAKWDITKLDNLVFDTTVSAVYTEFISSLSSDVTRSTGRVVFYAEGDFSDDQLLEVEKLEDDLYIVKRDSVKGISSIFYNRELEEQWHITIPEDGLSTHAIRFLPSGISNKTPEIYLHSQGEWNRAEISEYGSYYKFDAEGTSVTVAVVTTNPIYRNWVIAITAAVVLIVLIIFIIVSIRRVAKKNARQEKLREERIKEIVENSSSNKEGLAGNQELIDLIGGKEVKETEEKEKPAKKKIVGGVVAAFITALLICAAVFFVQRPEVVKAYAAKFFIHRLTGDKALEYRVDTKFVSAGNESEAEAYVWNTTAGEKNITAIDINGIMFYCNEGRVYLENGKTFEMSEVLPDFEQAMLLVEDYIKGSVTERKKVDAGTEYTISVDSASSGAILKCVCAEYTELIEKTGSVKAIICVDNWAVKEVKLSGSAWLNDGRNVIFDCVMTPVGDDEKENHEIPKEVLASIEESKDALKITGNMLNLLYAFGKFRNADPMVCDIKVSAIGGLLSINDNLSWFRAMREGEWISCVEKNGISLFYTDKGACTAKGISLTDAQQTVVDSAAFLDVAYEASLRGDISVESYEDHMTYRLTLSAEDVKALVEKMSSEIKDSDIEFTEGTLTVIVADGNITQIAVRLPGSVRTFGGVRSFSLTAKAVPMSFGEDCEIPSEVINTLLGK